MITDDRPAGLLAVTTAIERSAMTFSVATHQRADTICVSVTGEIDISTTTLLEQALTDALATDARAITVDLSATTFCDCTGITTLLTARRRAQAANVQYSVTNPQQVIRRLLELLDLYDLLLGHRDEPRSEAYARTGDPTPGEDRLQ